jgi:hypothetical protein
MELREADDFLEVLHVETVPAGLPGAGDLCLSIRVFSAGFSGSSGSVWTDPPSFGRFLAQLRELEATRHGVARLEALGSPDECWLEFRSIDRAGHLAVFGQLSRWALLSSAQDGYHQRVEFGFEFCPSRLPAVLAAFQQMAAARGSPNAD